MLVAVPEVVSVCWDVFVFACVTPLVCVVAFVLVCADVFAFVGRLVRVSAVDCLISAVPHVLTELYQKA